MRNFRNRERDKAMIVLIEDGTTHITRYDPWVEKVIRNLICLRAENDRLREVIADNNRTIEKYWRRIVDLER